MKTFLTIVAVGTVAAAPALAQPVSLSRAHAYHQEQSPLVQVYGAQHYQRRAPQEDVNPDFQLGGNRS
jgi:hypothetical protein